MTSVQATNPRLRAMFFSRPLAVIFPAEIVSNLGNQLARFALAALVFDRTSSASASALTYATSFLPSVLGGIVLARIGDRLPRRWVMVVVDVIRAVLFLAMAVNGIPLGLLVVLLALAVFIDPVFSAAQVSYLAETLTADEFRSSSGVRISADQLGQVAGFGLAGVVVLLVHPRGALVIDAVTFAVSALLILAFLTEPERRTTSEQADDGPRRPDRRDFGGLWRDSRTRLHMAFTVVVGLFVLPEALAIPYADRLGSGTARAGLLLAAIPLGSALGSVLIIRVPQAHRRRLAAALAITSGIPLIASAWYPDWVLSATCWFLCGLLTAYQVEVISALVAAMPADLRATLVGQAGAWLLGSQGICFALAGVLAGAMGPGAVIAVGAGAGCLAATAAVALERRRVRPGAAHRRARHAVAG